MWPSRPAGAGRNIGATPTFVIQKHDATTLHYDVRLEVDGVLKSWAVPKGPSLDPREKRLAVEVEDHAVDYGGFEGVIGDGRYGSGAVIVWDRGTYRNLTECDGAPVGMDEGLDAGHVHVWLDGEKLRGGFALTRTGREGKRVRWILVKVRDEAAEPGRDPVADEPASVVSGRTVEQVPAE